MEHFVTNWCHSLFKGLKLGWFTKIFECRTICGWSDVLNPFSCTSTGSKHTIRHQQSLLIWLKQSSLSKASRYLTEARHGSRWKLIGIADEWKKVRKQWTPAHINSQLIHFSVKMEMSCLLHFRVICRMLFLRIADTNRGMGWITAHRLSDMGCISITRYKFCTWSGN